MHCPTRISNPASYVCETIHENGADAQAGVCTIPEGVWALCTSLIEHSTRIFNE
jgi:hypothetical protein